MKIRAFSATVIGAAALVFLLFLLVTLAPPTRTEADNEGSKIRWDIFSLTGTTIAEGGLANAFADDNSKITLTGSGTFVTTTDSSERRVTGGGNWQTFDPQGNSTGSGTYKVGRLQSFDPAPGSAVLGLAGLTDTIGDVANAHTGLAVFAIEYSDESRGTLVVSCSFGPGTDTPPSIFEGITATKGFVGYWNRENGLVIATADQTIFHVVPKTD
jgi:hypothetical protein